MILIFKQADRAVTGFLRFERFDLCRRQHSLISVCWEPIAKVSQKQTNRRGGHMRVLRLTAASSRAMSTCFTPEMNQPCSTQTVYTVSICHIFVVVVSIFHTIVCGSLAWPVPCTSLWTNKLNVIDSSCSVNKSFADRLRCIAAATAMDFVIESHG